MALAIIAEQIADGWPALRLIEHSRPPSVAPAPITTHRLTHVVKEEAAMKKFVNDPKQFVPEMLQGLALANPDTLKYVPEYNLIMRADAPNANKVSIVQGSGSGHEPAHVMVVGKGMLDAACPGDVFAAPPMDYVLETTKLVASPKGVLLLVNNYTGDRMAFEMAQEMAEAEDIKVKTLFIDDDVSVQNSTYTVGRRGVAGNFFVMKAVGAAAEEGADLDEVVRIGEKVNSVTRTMGMALTACTPPAKGSPLFELGDDEIEMGVGIHGEPGRRRAKHEAGQRHHRRVARGGGLRPALRVRRPGRADDQRPRRHPDQRAVPALRPGAPAAGRPRDHRRPQLRRRVLHLAGHGRRVPDPGQARRRDRAAAGRAGGDRHPDLLNALAPPAYSRIRAGIRRADRSTDQRAIPAARAAAATVVAIRVGRVRPCPGRRNDSGRRMAKGQASCERWPTTNPAHI